MKTTSAVIDSLTPYASNPKKHSDKQIEAVANSIRQFGFLQPLVVDGDNNIIVGHCRWQAASLLGMKRVPVVRVADLTPEMIRAYRIADNRLAEMATWDTDSLLAEMRVVVDAVDMSSLGFDPEEIAALMGNEIQDGQTDPDQVPDPPDDPVTQPGDLWTMGDHRLLCGDSSVSEDVDKLLDGAAIHLVNTDPPYNVRVEPRSNNAIAAGRSSFTQPKRSHHQGFDLARHPEKAQKTHTKMRAKDRPLDNDFVSDEAFEQLLHAWFGNIARVLLPGRSWYVWGGYANCGNYPPVLKACGLYFSQAIIWVKEHPVLNRKDFMGNHDWCFYGWREGAGHRFFGPANVPDVWEVKKINPPSMIHLTEKPVELALRPMQYSSLPGENVLDLFGGSGSTLIAAEQAGRRAFLMEIDPPYCDVIVERWQKFTGRKAQLATKGKRRGRKKVKKQQQEEAPAQVD